MRLGEWGTRACIVVLGLISAIQPALAEGAVDKPVETWAEAERNRELICLAEGIYFEARGESIQGKLAVGRVILNRVKSEAYPDSVCDVVYQNKDRHNRCQFSFACDGKPDRVKDRAQWQEILMHAAWLLASDLVDGSPPEVRNSTHYHADYVKPKWAPYMKFMKKIGLHIFYKTYGGGWS